MSGSCSHYYWGVDDVTISSNEVVNDLEVVQVVNGDVFNVFEYRVTPIEQAILGSEGGMLAGETDVPQRGHRRQNKRGSPRGSV